MLFRPDSTASILVSSQKLLSKLDQLIKHPAVVHATFYAASDKYHTAVQPNIIIPVGTLSNNSGAQASVPPQVSVGKRAQSLALVLMYP